PPTLARASSPYTTLFRSEVFLVLEDAAVACIGIDDQLAVGQPPRKVVGVGCRNHPIRIAIDHQDGLLDDREVRPRLLPPRAERLDRKSTRLNSSHVAISY